MCGCNLYFVHEEMTSLTIPFSLNGEKNIYKKIDSFNLKNFDKKCSNPIMEVDKGSIILYLNNCEGYLFEINKKEIILNAFIVDRNDWITKNEQVNDTLFSYVKNRILSAFPTLSTNYNHAFRSTPAAEN
jgi:hypothetical protein